MSDVQPQQTGSKLQLLDAMLDGLPPFARSEVERRLFSMTLMQLHSIKAVAVKGPTDAATEFVDPDFIDSASKPVVEAINRDSRAPGSTLKFLNTVNDAMSTFFAEIFEDDADAEFVVDAMHDVLAGHAQLFAGAVYLQKTESDNPWIQRGTALKAERDEEIRRQASGNDAPASVN